MTRMGDALAKIGEWMVEPFRPFLLWFIEATGIEPVLERIVRWIDRRLP